MALGEVGWQVVQSAFEKGHVFYGLSDRNARKHRPCIRTERHMPCRHFSLRSLWQELVLSSAAS